MSTYNIISASTINSHNLLGLLLIGLDSSHSGICIQNWSHTPRKFHSTQRHIIQALKRRSNMKGKVVYAPQESVARRWRTTVTRGQWDARPTVTLPAARHPRPLAGTKLYCLVTEARVLTTCPGLHSTVGRLGFEHVWPTAHKSSFLPLCHRAT